MPENPIAPTPNQVFGTGTAPSPEQVYSSKPTTQLTPEDFSIQQTGIDKFKQIIANIPDMDEGKKKIVEDVALRGLRGQELSDVILTLQGKHPHQEGNTKYYVDEKGIPKPLKNSERPPVGYEVASIWGTQKEANDDAWYTDLAKTVYNILPSSAENVVDLVQTGYELVTDKESEYLNTLKNSANFLKMSKDEDLNKSLFNTQGVDEWKDLADKERWDFTPQTVWGTVNGLLGSVGEFVVGGSAVAKIIGTTAKASKAAQITGSVLTNLGEVRDAATEAGLTGRDRAIFTAAVAPIVSAIDVKWGLANKIVNNPAAEAEKKAFFKALGKGLAKDAEGNFTKEALDELPKLVATGYAQVAKQIGKLTAKDVLQEGGQEATQAFIQNAGEQLWDKLTDEEKKKFGTDAFSPESFGEYIQNGLAGLLGGAPTVLAVNQAKNLAKQENQDLNAFELAKKGDKAVEAFKQNVDLEVKRGNLTPDEGANAIFKVEAFKQYHDQLGDVNMPEEDKFKVLRMSFEKANLESQIPTDYKTEQLNPIEQAKVEVKKKEAKALQDEINNLVQRHVIAGKETVVADKTIKDVDDKITKEEEMFIPKEGKTKISKGVLDIAARARGEQLGVKPTETTETKPVKLNYQGTAFEEITPLQWNERKHRDSERFKYLVNKLTTENDVMPGNLFLPEDTSTYDTVKIELPGKKFVSSASSARDLNTQLRGHFRTERVEGNMNTLPIVVKPIQLTSGKTVLGVYSEENGKFLSYVREHDTGKSAYSEKEIEELQHMQSSSKLTASELAGYKTKREELSKKKPKAVKNEAKQEAQPVGEYQQSPEAINKEAQATKEVATEQKPKPVKEPVKKVGDEEAKAIKAAVNSKPQTFEEAVLTYFLRGGRMLAKDFIRYTGFGAASKEFKQRIWAFRNDAMSIDNLVKVLWMEDLELGEENFDETDAINDFFDVMGGIKGKRDALNKLLESKKNILKAEEYATPEAIAYAEQLDREEKELNERELTDEEVEDMLIREQYQNEYYEYLAEKYEDDEGYTREEQKTSKGAEPADVNRVVEAMKKVMPKIEFVYNQDLPLAGRLVENKIEINPYYAGKDTPIHEAGHVLISAMINEGGEAANVINDAINQLRGTELWNTIAEVYSDLSEEALGIEVLAEAIGVEGEGIFETEEERSKFMQYLDYIFNWIKQRLGIDKNIAKSLAKQIIAGIGTKNLTYEGTEQQQKEKGKRAKKKYQEMSEAQREYADMLTFDLYRQEKFGKLNRQVAEEIDLLKAELEKEELNDNERAYVQSVLNTIERQQKSQLRDYYQYRDDVKRARAISQELDNPEITDEQRGALINELYTLDNLASKDYLNDAQLKFGKHFFDVGNINLSKNKKFDIEKAFSGDISTKDVWLKTLSHMTEKNPDLQVLSNLYEKSTFDMLSEASDLKNTYEKLGKAVIKEANKKLGITGAAASLFSSDSAKYFDYLEKDGQLLTIEQAKKAGLTPTQIEFLKLMREIVAQQQGITQENDSLELEVPKVDPRFWESFKAEGMLRAVANFLGSSYNLRQIRIAYTDPNTGTEKIDDFGTIEKKILDYGKKGPTQKVKSVALLMKYNSKARKQLKKGVNVDNRENPLEIKGAGEYSLNYKGQLESKFNRPRSKDRGYSRDFYAAGIQLIDDMMHVKHMSKLVPVVNSLEYLAKKGFENPLTGEKIAAKKNTAKWIEEWKKMHILKEINTTVPELDATLKFLRGLTSATTMMFNIPAGVMNIFMGVYNNWRAENGGKVALGNKRLFGAKGINPYAKDILKKYKVVSTDYDSNPKLYVGRLFDNLGHAVTQLGEFYIQGSMFLGLMTEEDYNSFEYKKDKHGVEQLVIKDSLSKEERAALEERLLNYKNTVSDIQGKYADKDRRNIMNSELGKAIFQFKVWMPDFWRMRFGEEYITQDGQVKKGSWRDFTTDAFKELREQVKDQGLKDFLLTAKDPVWTAEELSKMTEKEMKEKGVTEDSVGQLKYPGAKNLMANLKGLVIVGTVMIFRYQDDDKKKKKVDFAEQALGNLLFILDPDQARYLVKSPFAFVGTVTKAIDAVEALGKGDLDKAGSTAFKLTPANKVVKSYETFFGD